MACENRFYRCAHCGNLVGMIHNAGVPIICCGEPMRELTPGESDGALEKHVPVLTAEGATVTVTVGAVDHPMTEEHFIEWIYLQTERGGQRKCLAPGGAPRAVFAVVDDKPVAAYAYCNLHGLWKADA